MAEIKGFTFAERLTSPYYKIRENAVDQIMDQAVRQVQASGGRPIIWIFAEKEAAQIVRALFDGTKDGRRDITVAYVPWTRDKP
jgi:NADPH-dependent ferric siderophore reductase